MSKIEWTGKTWNPVHGCTKISPGCQNCYAERQAKRLQAMGNESYEFGFRPMIGSNELLGLPRKWHKPSMIFVCSMGDLFHDDIPDFVIEHIWEVMSDCTQHTFQILTKRPERMRQFLQRYGNCVALYNVWLGVTAENQEQADKRIPILLDTPAAVRFASVEPMLGPVDLTEVRNPDNFPGCVYTDALAGKEVHEDDTPVSQVQCSKLDWVICGGETGPGARPMHPTWARDLRDQCAAADVPFFYKKPGVWGVVREFQSFPKYRDHVAQWYRKGDLVMCADGTFPKNGGPDGKVYPISLMRRVGAKAAAEHIDDLMVRQMPQAGQL